VPADFAELLTGADSAFFLVGCSKSKVKHLEPRPACEVYKGYVFSKVRDLYEAVSSRARTLMAIVSAKYGVIKCDDPVEYYDEVLKLRLSELIKWVELHKPARKLMALTEGGFELGVVVLTSAYLKALILDDSNIFLELPIGRYLAVIPPKFKRYFPEGRTSYRFFSGRGQLYKEISEISKSVGSSCRSST